MNWPQRMQQLLTQLEDRAQKCPGLYPVRTAADFLRIVEDHLAQDAASSPASAEEKAIWLEELSRRPELSYQLNAQSLIGRGASPFQSESGQALDQKATG